MEDSDEEGICALQEAFIPVEKVPTQASSKRRTIYVRKCIPSIELFSSVGRQI